MNSTPSRLLLASAFTPTYAIEPVETIIGSRR